MKKKPSNDQEMRMSESAFDRVMNKVLGVAPPPMKKATVRKRAHKKRS